MKIKSIRLRKALFENLKYLFSEASALKLSVDLTLGSGWSSGGPFIKDFPAQQLVKSELEISGPYSGNHREIQEPSYINKTNFIVNKTIGKFDEEAELVRVILAKVEQSTTKETLSELKDVSNLFDGTGIKLDIPKGKYKLFLFIRIMSL